MKIYYITSRDRRELYWGDATHLTQTYFINRLNETYNKNFRVRDVPRAITITNESKIRGLANTGAKIYKVT